MASSFLVYIPYESTEEENEGTNEQGDDGYNTNKSNMGTSFSVPAITVSGSVSTINVKSESPTIVNGLHNYGADSTATSPEEESGLDSNQETRETDGLLSNQMKPNAIRPDLLSKSTSSLKGSQPNVGSDLPQSNQANSGRNETEPAKGKTVAFLGNDGARFTDSTDVMTASNPALGGDGALKKGKFTVQQAKGSGVSTDGVVLTSVRRVSRGNILDPESTAIGSSGSAVNLKEIEQLGDLTQTADLTTEVMTLRKALQDLLHSLNIENDVWKRTDDGNSWQITFVIESARCDKVLQILSKSGFGRIAETSVSVFAASFHNSQSTNNSSASKEKLTKEKNEFLKSIKSRLTVAQVAGAVQSNATLTFDFLVLIILAGIIAGLGLAESSSVSLVASMLISPLMGPIIGFTFGVVVENKSLWKLGVRNEIIGLSICLTYGFLFGLLTGAVNNTGAIWGATSSWPTPEMKARGMLRSLWVGVLIALPSGAGVALSILGGNTGSLVGVAISASLLPPAVNAGMLWGLALVSAISHPPFEVNPLNTNSTVIYYPPDCPALQNNDYEFAYSCNMQTEAAILGSVSLLLTILNIICIFFMGIIILKVKQMAPHTALSPATEAFWKKDIAICRENYRTTKGAEARDLASQAKQILAEMKANNMQVEDVIEDLKNDPGMSEVTSNMLKNGPDVLNEVAAENHKQRDYQLSQCAVDDHVLSSKYHTVSASTDIRRLLSPQMSVDEQLDRHWKSPRISSQASAGVALRVNRCQSMFPATAKLSTDVEERGKGGGRGEGRREGERGGGAREGEGDDVLMLVVNEDMIRHRRKSHRHDHDLSDPQHRRSAFNWSPSQPIDEENTSQSSESHHKVSFR